jgi:hypothetical protein
MRAHGGLKSEEADDAAWEAVRGAGVGAARVRCVVLRFAVV